MGERTMIAQGPDGTDERKPPYLVQYRHKGSDWSLTLWAESWDDAQARLRSIGYNGSIIGSNVSEIRANALNLPFVGPWVALVCWWRNLGRKER